MTLLSQLDAETVDRRADVRALDGHEREPLVGGHVEDRVRSAWPMPQAMMFGAAGIVVLSINLKRAPR
jgi:hypothetical protein